MMLLRRHSVALDQAGSSCALSYVSQSGSLGVETSRLSDFYNNNNYGVPNVWILKICYEMSGTNELQLWCGVKRFRPKADVG